MRGMPQDAVLTSVDIDPEHQRMAKQAYVEAGLGSFRTRMITGPALEVLPRLTDGAYDMVFCDAQKREYPDYLIDALRLLRPGGVVAFDNALWHDRVADPEHRDPDTEAIREVHRMIRDDERLVPMLLAVGDGLLCAVKRGWPGGSRARGVGGAGGPGGRAVRRPRPGVVAGRLAAARDADPARRVGRVRRGRSDGGRRDGRRPVHGLRPRRVRAVRDGPGRGGRADADAPSRAGTGRRGGAPPGAVAAAPPGGPDAAVGRRAGDRGAAARRRRHPQGRDGLRRVPADPGAGRDGPHLGPAAAGGADHAGRSGDRGGRPVVLRGGARLGRVAPPDRQGGQGAAPRPGDRPPDEVIDRRTR